MLDTFEVDYTTLLASLKALNSSRNELLFTKFLPTGYQLTTLSSVSDHLFDPVISTKIRIGTLITLYDDFADHPKMRDIELLRQLYKIPFSGIESNSNHPAIRLASDLWKRVILSIQKFPNYKYLEQVFEFDVQQFYNANRYAELVSDNPYLANQRENRIYSPHNMGIIVAATIDLMASENLDFKELGRIRDFFHRAQDIARIMNVITTLDREVADNDVTGEIAAALLERGHLQGDRVPISEQVKATDFYTPIIQELSTEQDDLFLNLRAKSPSIRTFDVSLDLSFTAVPMNFRIS